MSVSRLAFMRTRRARFFDKTCTIRATAEGAVDVGGGWPSGTVTDVADVLCNLSPVAEGDPERVIADRLGVVTAWVIALPAGQVVTAAAKILIGSRSFEIKAVVEGHSYATSTRVLAEEIP